MSGPNLRATGRAVRRPASAPVLVYPELEFDIPTRIGGRLPGPLPAPHGRDQAEPADHRPVPPPDAGRADHGQAAAPPAAAAGPRLRRRRGAARPVRDVRDQRRDRPAVPDADPRSVVHPPPVRRAADAGQPDRRHDGRSWPAWTRSWAGSTSDASIARPPAVSGDGAVPGLGPPDAARARSSSR